MAATLFVGLVCATLFWSEVRKATATGCTTGLSLHQVRLTTMATWCLCMGTAAVQVLGGAIASSLLLFYSLLLLVYMHPIEPTMTFRDFVLFVARVVLLVFLPGDDVHFLEVLVGDILTSLSKVFQVRLSPHRAWLPVLTQRSD